MRNKIVWSALSWVFGLLTLNAQQQPVKISLHYGYPDVVLHAVASDENQLIYLSTNHGFYRYDGSDLKEINWLPKDIPVSKLVVAGDSLLIGQKSGHFILASLSLQKILLNDSITDVSIGQMAVCNDRSLLFGTAGNGIFLRSTAGETISVTSELSDPYINHLHFNPVSGIATIATDRGLDQLKITATGSPEFLQHIHTENDIYRSIVSGSGDDLIASGDVSGLLKITTGNSGPEILKADSNPQREKLFHALDQIWVLENQFIIHKLAGLQNTTPVFQEIARFSEPVVDILGIHEGYLMVWQRDGTLQLVPVNYSTFKSIGRTSMSGITAMCRTPDETIWAAREDELIEISNQEGIVQVLRTIQLPETSNFPIISLAEKNNRLLAGSFGDGLFVFDLQTNNLLTHLNEGTGLDNNSILDIAVSENNIWISTMSGVQSVSGKTEPELHSLSGSPGYIYCLKANSDGRLFVGSQGESMFVNEGMQLRSAVENDTTTHSFISIECDAQGNIWGLTTDSKLFRVENDEFQPHPLNDELTGLAAYRLFSSPSGHVGLISDHALYDISEMNSAYELLGAPGLFTSEYQNISTVDSDGDFWLAGINGLVLIEARVLKSNYLPRTEIETLYVNRELSELNSTGSFGHTANNLSFILRSVWHDPYRPVVSEYRMAGLDTTWRTIIDKELHFAKLSPSKYDLELRTLFGPTMNPVHSTNYAFQIAPPIYMQSWFIVLMAVLLLMLLVVGIRWRDRRMATAMALKTERIQTRFEVLKNQINPHFLFNSFNTLAALIPDDPKKAEHFTEKLSAFFREILTSKDNDTNSLERELQLAEDFIFLQQSRYGENLMYDVAVDSSKLKYEIPTLSLQILIENAVKHNQISKTSPLRISVHTKGDLLVVSNNLQLRSTPMESTGLGLNNLSHRLQILTGKNIEIVKSFGNFSVTIPLVKCE